MPIGSKNVGEENRKYLAGNTAVGRSVSVMYYKCGKQNTKGTFNSHEIHDPSYTTFGAHLFELRWPENLLSLFFVELFSSVFFCF